MIIGNFKECFKKCEISTYFYLRIEFCGIFFIILALTCSIWIIFFFFFYENNCNSNIEPGPNSPLSPIFDPNHHPFQDFQLVYRAPLIIVQNPFPSLNPNRWFGNKLVSLANVNPTSAPPTPLLCSKFRGTGVGAKPFTLVHRVPAGFVS